MCLTLPDTLITVMGIEKVVPRFTDLRSLHATAAAVSTGTDEPSHLDVDRCTPGRPQDFHLVLLDNGRTRVLGDRWVGTPPCTASGAAPA